MNFNWSLVLVVLVLCVSIVPKYALSQQSNKTFFQRVFGNIFSSKATPTEQPPNTNTVRNSSLAPMTKIAPTPFPMNHTSSSVKEESAVLSANDILMLKSYCPELKDVPNIQQYRFNEETRKCQQLQWRGTCGENMIFYRRREQSIYGECGCKISRRIILPHTGSNKCHEIFSQGFCPHGQWVDISSELEPVCVDNPCSNLKKSANDDLVLVKGKCVEVGKKSDVCPERTVVGFEWATKKPTCVPDVGSAIGVPMYKCPRGTFRAINMRCVKPVDLGDSDD